MKSVILDPKTKEVVSFELIKAQMGEMFKATIVEIDENVNNLLYGTISVHYERYASRNSEIIYNRSRDNPELKRCNDQITLEDPTYAIDADSYFFFDVNIKEKGHDESTDKEVCRGRFTASCIYDTPLAYVILGKRGAIKVEYALVSDAVRAKVQLMRIDQDETYVNVCGRVTALTTKFPNHEIVLFDASTSQPVSMKDFVPLSRSFIVVPSESDLIIQACIQTCNDPTLGENGNSNSNSNDNMRFTIQHFGLRTSERDINFTCGQFKLIVQWGQA